MSTYPSESAKRHRWLAPASAVVLLLRVSTSPKVAGASWSRLVCSEDANRRAGGRRAINARRRFFATERRAEVARLLGELGFRWGAQTAIARTLRVHRSTISRDIQKLFRPLDPDESKGS